MNKTDMKQKKLNVFWRLQKFALPYAGYLVLALILVLSVTALDLYRPIILGNVIDLFKQNGNFDDIKVKAFTYLAVIVLIFVCNFGQTWILALTGQKIIYNVRQKVFEHVQSLSLRFFDITPVGKIVTRVTNDVEALNEMFTQVLINLIKNTIKIIGLAVTMLILDWHLALLGFALIPIIAVLTYFFRSV